MRVSGTLTDAAGPPLAGAQSVTFALYDERDGGTLLWSEAQMVTADASGRYVAYLGAASAVPPEIFRSETARWLQVSVAGRDLPRVMLVAVPYALKAADAETVGGKPASAFVLADRPAGGAITAAGTIDPLVTAGTPGRLAVFTTATDVGDSVVFQTGSHIGVATAAPAAPFHVAASQAPGAMVDVYSNALGALPLVSRAARGTPFAPLPVQDNDILGGLAVRGYAPSGFTGGKGQIMFRAVGNWTDTSNGTQLQFMTTPAGSTTFAERMRITHWGSVGIGTTSPLGRLQVIGDGNAAVWASGGTGYGVVGESSSGTAVYASSDTGTALWASSSGANIALFFGPGNVGIGTVAADKLQVAGDIRIGNIGTGQGLGCVKDEDGSVIAGTCSSDRRLKRDVTPFGRSLDAVVRLQPVSFGWRAEEFPDRHFGHARAFGLIAQDVEAVLPELVATDAEGYKAVKYQQLPFYLLQAIKDLRAEKDEAIKDLKAENDDLKARLQRLEAALRR